MNQFTVIANFAPLSKRLIEKLSRKLNRILFKIQTINGLQYRTRKLKIARIWAIHT